jgi:hypothetical protein
MTNRVAGHSAPKYLAPYIDAARQHNGGFHSLLWATRDTQAARFDAICRLENPRGRFLLDVGCGRADLLDFCIARGMTPADYVGIEGVAQLVEIAKAKRHARAKIVLNDFVADPQAVFVGADMIVMSGSLNTLRNDDLHDAIRRAFDATSRALVFNFLATPGIAAADYLHWRAPADVLSFVHTLSRDVRLLDDYLRGDCTIAVRKD